MDKTDKRYLEWAEGIQKLRDLLVEKLLNNDDQLSDIRITEIVDDCFQGFVINHLVRDIYSDIS